MRVAIVSDYFPPVAPGGAELSAYYLARALSDRAEVEVVTTEFGATLDETPFPVHYIPLSGVITDGRYAKDPRQLFAGGVRPFSRKRHYIEFGRALQSLTRQREFDVIHTQQPGADLASYIAGPLIRAPRVTTLRGYSLLTGRWRDDAASAHGIGDRRGGGVRSRLRWWLPRRAARSARHVFTVSEFVRRRHVEHGIARDGHSSALFNILPNTEAQPIESAGVARALDGIEGPVVLFAGRLTRGKGLHMLIDSMPLLLRHIPECRLVVAGGGDQEPFKRLAGHNLADYSVRFLGHVPNETLLGLAGRASVIAAPSLHHEPLGRIILEAIAAGKPVVATPYGGTPELIKHGKNGLLTESADPEALARLLLQAITDRGLIRSTVEYDQELRRTVLDPERTVSRTLEVYREALAA